MTSQPSTELDAHFSDPEAAATPWSAARAVLADAGIYWVSTTRPDARPHVTPLIAVLHADALWFTSGAGERKSRNLAATPHAVLTTGANAYGEGTDVVVEGPVDIVTDEAVLAGVAAAYVAKYGEDWRFTVRDGAFEHAAGRALVYRLTPVTAFAFAKGRFGQTRYRF